MKYLVVRGLVGVFGSLQVARAALKPGHVVIAAPADGLHLSPEPTNRPWRERGLRVAPPGKAAS